MPYLIVPSVYYLGLQIPSCARVRGRREGWGCSCGATTGEAVGALVAPDPSATPDPDGVVEQPEPPRSTGPVDARRVASVTPTRTWGAAGEACIGGMAAAGSPVGTEADAVGADAGHVGSTGAPAAVEADPESDPKADEVAGAGGSASVGEFVPPCETACNTGARS